jgi:ABC-2 type transport system permease protein
MSAVKPVPAGSPAGNIYDLGYRHYDGKRHGRAYAAWSLYVESLRSVWGFGRPARAKAAPLIIAGLYAFPAAIQLAFASLLAQRISQGEDVGLFTYDNYYVQFGFFMILFLVAQAPELVCRDQRYQVLSLYFTRALRRSDYALAKLGALTTALFLALMLPAIVLFVGDVLMKPDALAAIGSEWPKALPVLPASLLVALGMASISLTLSSFSPRRAYAAIGLVAYFLLMEAVPAAIWGIGHSDRVTWDWSDKLLLLAPSTTLGAAGHWFFGSAVGLGSEFSLSLTTGNFLMAAIASILVFSGVLLLRYRRLSV